MDENKARETIVEAAFRMAQLCFDCETYDFFNDHDMEYGEKVREALIKLGHAKPGEIE